MKRGYIFRGIYPETIRDSQRNWSLAKWDMNNGIFISHKKEDLELAIDIGREVAKRTKIPCYVDELDSNIENDSADLAVYIQEIIHRCQSLLAIISHHTINSWWVPLEIGVALENKKYISSYKKSDGTMLPSYLWSWPTMTTKVEAVKWAKATRKSLNANELHQAWRRSKPREFSDRLDFFDSL